MFQQNINQNLYTKGIFGNWQKKYWAIGILLFPLPLLKAADQNSRK